MSIAARVSGVVRHVVSCRDRCNATTKSGTTCRRRAVWNLLVRVFEGLSESDGSPVWWGVCPMHAGLSDRHVVGEVKRCRIGG